MKINDRAFAAHHAPEREHGECLERFRPAVYQPHIPRNRSDRYGLGCGRNQFVFHLCAKYYGPVLGYVLRRAPAPVAADVVADVFLVVWRRLEQVPEEPLPWLLGVARKTLANEKRGGRRRAALLDSLKETSTDEHDLATPVNDPLPAVGTPS